MRGLKSEKRGVIIVCIRPQKMRKMRDLNFLWLAHEWIRDNFARNISGSSESEGDLNINRASVNHSIHIIFSLLRSMIVPSVCESV